MEGLSLVLGVFALLWFSTFLSQRKANTANIDALKEVYQNVLNQYKSHLNGLSEQHLRAAQEMRQMYDNNIRLVEQSITLNERYEKRSESLERLIQTNIQCWQEAITSVKAKGYCPNASGEKT
ncbi:MAG: hypothetical protein ACYC6G_14115 [Desulfobaccales bacterium]